jgi:hypothetical protein
MLYPKPDRSDQKPSLVKTPENDVIDIGWNEGVLSDGRPLPRRVLAQEQVTSLTSFFSTHGLEDITNAQFGDFLVHRSLHKAPLQRYLAGATPIIE